MRLPFPSIAAINGHALAGGMMLAMSHDIRVCSDKEGLKFGMTEINLGITIPDGMVAPLDAKLSPNVMRDVCLFGKTIFSKEALENKIVDYVVPHEELLKISLDIARRLAPLGEKRLAF